MCQVTGSHVGQNILVSNDGVNYTSRRLVAIDVGNYKPYVVRAASGNGVEAFPQAIPPGYRVAVLSDIGRDVEVSANGREWKTRRLVGFDATNPRKFIARAGSGRGGWFWKLALVRT